ncbi:MAG: hypothetical protein GAK28_04252 [Luteibacter sp.]|uniref:hypothetical protein n=1 Tax=Luteibacter sp. TaxID=1886636 RepID=UPI0013833DD9|nr:hypothetical protein [Luteibacter sp.]KAF1004088.1 MAG: hypothetical protein GAK28_04252 [Luteibacter sp.]
MEQQRKAMHDDTIANPFIIQMEGPMPPGSTSTKINPKVAESTDLGLFGSRHPGGDHG